MIIYLFINNLFEFESNNNNNNNNTHIRNLKRSWSKISVNSCVVHMHWREFTINKIRNSGSKTINACKHEMKIKKNKKEKKINENQSI